MTLHNTTPSPQRILDTAVTLFGLHGYQHVTLNDIAEQSGCSLESVCGHFKDKDAITLAIYQQLGETTRNTTFPPARLDECFVSIMDSKLVQFQPHRDALAVFFGSAMKADSTISFVSSDNWVDPMQAALDDLARNVIDGLEDMQAVSMGKVLYALYLLMTIFWLYDRTPQQNATRKLVRFMGEVLRLIRPMLIMPMFAKALSQFAEIVSNVFGEPSPRATTGQANPDD